MNRFLAAFLFFVLFVLPLPAQETTSQRQLDILTKDQLLDYARQMQSLNVQYSRLLQRALEENDELRVRLASIRAQLEDLTKSIEALKPKPSTWFKRNLVSLFSGAASVAVAIAK